MIVSKRDQNILDYLPTMLICCRNGRLGGWVLMCIFGLLQHVCIFIWFWSRQWSLIAPFKWLMNSILNENPGIHFGVQFQANRIEFNWNWNRNKCRRHGAICRTNCEKMSAITNRYIVGSICWCCANNNS